MKPELQRARADESQSTSRKPLEAYFQEIGGTRTLLREEEVELAKALEAATGDLRTALYAVPYSARHAVRRWDALRAASHSGAKLSEAAGEESPGEIAARVERAANRLRRLLAERERALADGAQQQIDRIDEQIGRAMERARFSLVFLAEVRTELLALAGALRQTRQRSRRRIELEAEAGLPLRRVRERMDEIEEAYERMTNVKNHFVSHNLKLVITVAKGYRNLGLSFSDLIQEGNLGLIRAVEKFDHRRGFKFSTYAVNWIRQSMVRGIQNYSRTIRLPSHVHDRLQRSKRVRAELAGKLGREPTPAELAPALGLDTPSLDALGELTREAVSLEAPVGGSEKRLEELVCDPLASKPEQGLDGLRVLAGVGDLLEALNPREQLIVRLRFGLENGEEHTLEQIGETLGLSRERVRQIESRTLKKLRETVPAQRLRSVLTP